MFKKLSLAFLGSAILSLSFGAYADCPLGQREQTLTIHRVMRNFGRFTMDADSVALRAYRNNETISTNELQVVQSKLGLAIDCAQAVINSPSGELLPDKAHDLSGQALQDYINDLVYFMTDFRDLLVDYRNLYQQLQGQEPAVRNYQSVYQKSEEIEDFVKHAHKKL